MMHTTQQHGLLKNLETSMTINNDIPTAELTQWLVRIGSERDKNAFSQIFKWFAPKIIRYGIKHLNSETSANELLQETMSNVWRKSHYYDVDKGAPTTWVYTVMRNVSFDMLRKIRSRREELLSDDIWPLVEANVVEDVEFDDHLMHRKINANILNLPSAQQQVIKGVYFDQLSHEALSKQLGIPIGTVKSRLRLALSKLKQHVGDNS
jgi:RNA polymerase sigma-70 factor (ECF subfamily)